MLGYVLPEKIRFAITFIATTLGALPHAKLDYSVHSDAPKKTVVRTLKAEYAAA